MTVGLRRRGAVAGARRRSVGGETTITQSIFTSQIPATLDATDGMALSVGTRFAPTIDGQVTHIRCYRPTTSPTSAVGALFTDAGAELGQATFGALSAGWNTVALASPISVTSGSFYRTVVWTNGPYVATSSAFPVTNSRLVADGGFYSYGASVAFPTLQFNNGNYFADVVFSYSLAGVLSPSTTGTPSSAAGAGQVQLAWTTPDSDGGAALTGYDVQQFIGVTGGAVTPFGMVNTATISSLSNGTAYTFKVRAKNPAGAGVWSNASLEATPSATLPARVLWEGGPAYYAPWSQAVASGMTVDTFFPMLVDFESVVETSNVNADLAYGVNGYYRLTTNSNMTLIRDAGMVAFPGALQTGVGNETVGWNIDDEVDMWGGPGWNPFVVGQPPPVNCGYDIMAQYTAVDGPLGPAVADGRMKHMNYGKGVVFWETAEQASVFVNGGKFGSKSFKLDAVSADLYFYSDRNTGREDDPANAEATMFLGIPTGQVRRAANYGMHVVKKVKDLQAAVGRHQPVYGFVEVTSQGDLTPQASYTDDMIEGAVWSCLIYEARGIIYFVHDFIWSGNYHNLRDDIGGHTARVTSLNARVAALAPVLNTQSFAVSYNATVDSMTKQHAGSWYIFAMSKRQATHDTAARTFTLHASQSGTQVQVVNESRTLPITGGTFTDSFAAEFTCHIYKVV